MTINNAVTAEAADHNVRPELIRTSLDIITNKLTQGWGVDSITDWWKQHTPDGPYAHRANVQTAIDRITASS